MKSLKFYFYLSLFFSSVVFSQEVEKESLVSCGQHSTVEVRIKDCLEKNKKAASHIHLESGATWVLVSVTPKKSLQVWLNKKDRLLWTDRAQGDPNNQIQSSYSDYGYYNWYQAAGFKHFSADVKRPYLSGKYTSVCKSSPLENLINPEDEFKAKLAVDWRLASKEEWKNAMLFGGNFVLPHLDEIYWTISNDSRPVYYHVAMDYLGHDFALHEYAVRCVAHYK